MEIDPYIIDRKYLDLTTPEELLERAFLYFDKNITVLAYEDAVKVPNNDRASILRMCCLPRLGRGESLLLELMELLFRKTSPFSGSLVEEMVEMLVEFVQDSTDPLAAKKIRFTEDAEKLLKVSSFETDTCENWSIKMVANALKECALIESKAQTLETRMPCSFREEKERSMEALSGLFKEYENNNRNVWSIRKDVQGNGFGMFAERDIKKGQAGKLNNQQQQRHFIVYLV